MQIKMPFYANKNASLQASGLLIKSQDRFHQDQLD